MWAELAAVRAANESSLEQKLGVAVTREVQPYEQEVVRAVLVNVTTEAEGICPKGYYCSAAKSNPCPRGTYNDQINQVDSKACKPCHPFCSEQGFGLFLGNTDQSSPKSSHNQKR